MEHPARVRRRLVPDDAQVQIILGSLLGGARIEGAAGERRMLIAHRVESADYVWWKYERLVVFAERTPLRSGDRIGFHTIAHPLFDDLAPLFASQRASRSRVMRDLLAPLGLAVWMTDTGRLELRPDLFLPAQRAFAFSAA
jgi:hypothetical protein